MAEAKEIKEPQEKLYPVILERDYWTGKSTETGGLVEEERVKAGTTIHVPAEEALRLIERRVATRADPLT